MMAPLREQVARMFAGRVISLDDIVNAMHVNETVARAIVADLKAMKLAKTQGTKPSTWKLSPPVCLDAMKLGEKA